MEHSSAAPPSEAPTLLQQILLLLLPLFIVGSFFSFKWESQPAAPHRAPSTSEAPLAPTSAEEQHYVEQVRDLVGDYVETLAQIGPLYEAYQQDQALLEDERWRSQLRARFDELRRISEQARGATPPGRYGPFHEKLTRVAQRYVLAGQLYQEGLTILDEETLLLANEAYSRANAGLAELINDELPLMRP